MAFHSNWPLLADDLVVASWKLDGAAAADLPLVDEADHELLDPKPPAEVDWRDTYAVDLAVAPGILQDLNNGGAGDGIERVLERAQLSAGERAVMRAWLYTPDLDTVTEDLKWNAVRVRALFRNATDRLRWLGQNPGSSQLPRSQPDVFSRNGHHVRARTPDVPVAAGARKRDHAQSRAS